MKQRLKIRLSPPRRIWKRNPGERIQESKKRYSRSKDKKELRKIIEESMANNYKPMADSK